MKDGVDDLRSILLPFEGKSSWKRIVRYIVRNVKECLSIWFEVVEDPTIEMKVMRFERVKVSFS